MQVLNKSLLASVMAVSLAAGGLYSGVAHAADTAGSGTITVTGKVIKAACSVSAGPEDMTVKLGQISLDVLKKTGHSTLTKATIRLDDCTLDADVNTTGSAGTMGKYSTVKVTFDGRRASGSGSDTDAFVNEVTSSNAANNVGVKLYDEHNQMIKAGMDPFIKADLSKGTTDINFYVAMAPIVAGGANMTTGDVLATIKYTLAYN